MKTRTFKTAFTAKIQDFETGQTTPKLLTHDLVTLTYEFLESTPSGSTTFNDAYELYGVLYNLYGTVAASKDDTMNAHARNFLANSLVLLAKM